MDNQERSASALVVLEEAMAQAKLEAQHTSHRVEAQLTAKLHESAQGLATSVDQKHEQLQEDVGEELESIQTSVNEAPVSQYHTPIDGCQLQEGPPAFPTQSICCCFPHTLGTTRCPGRLAGTDYRTRSKGHREGRRHPRGTPKHT